mmetsp:Transcript_82127/g.232562  ORF Transcript_82127/g.232562 Transcript_82127/m.232562 type:complete len:785 (-) Transcript_82127:70-2424(-)|eukprot:CAMPEP_0168421904 /NCGR_PEP_ID=MMETSP0228-20121227/33521_1 /TAXON_ID=133427 /ORGANISM="Protoceratium reticulatum, Strain CCCM 535 (=CCMP 1889)" /LENGTH=784 /DNA_ID=CAMNT_0008435825 /DNA_START=116 /DNA_END=2470 /DNA_ORIENTATION=-
MLITHHLRFASATVRMSSLCSLFFVFSAFQPCVAVRSEAVEDKVQEHGASDFADANATARSRVRLTRTRDSVGVVFENDSPQELEMVSITHKCPGHVDSNLPGSGIDVLVWEKVPAWSTTEPQVVKSAYTGNYLNDWAGTHDWWVVAWQYKRTPDSYYEIYLDLDGHVELGFNWVLSNEFPPEIYKAIGQRWTIANIDEDKGWLHGWNSEHPGMEVRVGDEIYKVNGVKGDVGPLERYADPSFYGGRQPVTIKLLRRGAPPEQILLKMGNWKQYFRLRSLGCQSCVKEDGTCETWLTSYTNALIQIFLDPMMYVKAAIAAATITVGLLTGGLLWPALVALGGLVVDGVAAKWFEGTETVGMFRSNLQKDSFQLWKEHQVPVKVRLLHSGGIEDKQVSIEQFKLAPLDDDDNRVQASDCIVGDIDHGSPCDQVLTDYSWSSEGAANIKYRPGTVLIPKLVGGAPVYESVGSTRKLAHRPLLRRGDVVTVWGPPIPRDNKWWVEMKPEGALELADFKKFKHDKQSVVKGAEMACTSPACGGKDGRECKDVPRASIRVVNQLGQKIVKLAVLHKHTGLTPKLQVFDYGAIESGGSSGPRQVPTLTGFGFRSDWWMAAWVEADDPCLVRSTVPAGLLQTLQAHPEEPLGKVAGVVMDKLLAAVFIGSAINLGFQVEKNIVSGKLGSARNNELELFGPMLLSRLKKDSLDTDAFYPCMLKANDVARDGFTPVGVMELTTDKHGQDWAVLKLADTDGKEQRRTCRAPAIVVRCLLTAECSNHERCNLKDG